MGMLWWLGDERCREVLGSGGKAANLSRLAGIHRIPPGFVVPAGVATPEPGTRLGGALVDEVCRAYRELSGFAEESEAPVAVRSSGIDEDGAGASFAGQHDSFLNVRGALSVLDAVVRCLDSARSARALAYRAANGVSSVEPAIAVLVQALVSADVSAVAFSANPVSGSHEEILVNASWGLGESVVSGRVTPDTYAVRRAGLVIGQRVVAKKIRMTIPDTWGTREVAVPSALQLLPCLRDEQVLEIAALALRVETDMGWPADIECAFSGDELYLLQCRPITAI